MPAGLSGVTAVAANVGHSLALKDDGSVVTWGCHSAPIGRPDFGQCNVPGELSKVLAIAAGYELALDAPDTPIETIGDAAALERALTNLVQNAIQHGPRRGTIGIRVSKPASIEVTDDGAGIPADQREAIFEPFYRLTPLERGAGLGLNMVREIVLLHGGHVSVADGAIGGVCFRMTLPPLRES